MPSEANVSALGSDNRAFAFDLYHQLASAQPDENLLFSPYSVSTALAMTYAGARGTTASELKATLHFELDDALLHEAFNATDLALRTRAQGQAGVDGAPFQLNVDNSLWAQLDDVLEPAFLDTLAVNYDAGMFSVDFSGDPDGARRAINDWVSDRTRALIPELLLPGLITRQTSLVLTNTVYFNASWQTPFSPEQTKAASFIKLDGSTAAVSMMNATLQPAFASGDGFEAIALPYANDALRLIAILPDEGAHQKVEAALGGAWFDALDQSWSLGQSVAVSLPKIDYGAKFELKDALEALGVRAAFGDADFSGITGDRSLHITHVVHQATLSATESGTVAAAATAVILGRHAADLAPPRQVVFNRPFFLAIVDEPTGTILFLGRVLDPTVK